MKKVSAVIAIFRVIQAHISVFLVIATGLFGLVPAVPIGAQQPAAGKVSSTDITNTTTIQLVPRTLAKKPPRTRLKPSDDRRHIEVKFLDGLRFDVDATGLLVERQGKALSSARARMTLTAIMNAGGRWHRLVTLPEKTMDEKRATAEKNLGRQVADMNSYYVLTVPNGVDAVNWIDQLNALADVEIAQPVPLPQRPPVPPSFQPDQGYLNAAPEGIDASSYAWALGGGTGQNVKICDFEYSWNLSHQDLPTVTTLIPAGRTAVDPFNDNNHGTAVLGEMASLNNNSGTTGIAYNATIFVAPVNWDNGYNLAAAITNAMGTLTPGSVMLIEQQTAGPNWTGPGDVGLVASEWQVSVYNAIVTAVGNGIHVVEAAGNGTQNLDDAVYGTGNGGHFPFAGVINSGAIIVGAGAAPTGSATTDRSRLEFSNYGTRVNVQGWGENVITTGYGDFYNTEGVNLFYTRFSGTSSASPIVAGGVALIEGIEEALHPGRPVSPGTMRSVLVSTGSPQQAGINPVSQNIGPRPSIRGAVEALERVTLGNISTRLRVDTGDNALIGGFIVTGTDAKKVIVRAIGPSLPFGGTLADPMLELRNGTGVLILANNDWRETQEAQILATGVAPTSNLESAIVATLPANNASYTAIVRGANNGTGVGLVEVYDLDRAVNSKLANISTRGLVGTGDNVMIGGTIILGGNPANVVLRGIGPSLTNFGVPNALADPTVELRNSNGALLVANDNWQDDPASAAQLNSRGLALQNASESGIFMNLQPGSYTAILAGKNGTTGVGLVEAYQVQ